MESVGSSVVRSQSESGIIENQNCDISNNREELSVAADRCSAKLSATLPSVQANLPARGPKILTKSVPSSIIINHTLQPASWIKRLLLRPQAVNQACVLRRYSQYGWQCTLVANPIPASLLQALRKESPGIVLLVGGSNDGASGTESTTLCMDILRRVFRESLRLRSNEAQWGAIARLLKRVKFNDEENVLFAINIPNPAVAPEMLDHLAMCGGICAADALLQAAVSAVDRVPKSLRWRDNEEIQVHRRHLGGDSIVTIVHCEKLETLEERMLTAWICKHIMAARTRALHRMSPRAASRSWNFKMSLTAPKGQKPNSASIWLLWEFRNVLEIGNPNAPGVCSILVAFRSFLSDALRQLKRRMDYQANQIVAQILNGPA